MSLQKQTTLTLLCGALLLNPTLVNSKPRPFGGDLTFRATARYSETSRVSPRADSRSDSVYSLIPAISYSLESNRLNLRSSLSFPMTRYDSTTSLDSNSINFSLSGNVPFDTGPKLTGSWRVNYNQGVQSNFLSNQNLDSTTSLVSLNSNYRLRNRLSLRSGLSFSDRSSSGIDSNFRNENQTLAYSAGIHARDLIGTIGAYADYRIQIRETKSGSIENENVNAKDDGINFGLTGQLLPERLFPKLDADLSFGFTSSEPRNSATSTNSRNNRLNLNGRLSYPASSKTDVSFTIRRNLDITDDDRTVESQQMSLSLSYRPRPKLSLESSVGLSEYKFLFETTDRSDEALTASLTGSYKIRNYWSASASYNYRDSSSNVSLSNYNTSQFSLSTTLSY